MFDNLGQFVCCFDILRAETDSCAETVVLLLVSDGSDPKVFYILKINGTLDGFVKRQSNYGIYIYIYRNQLTDEEEGLVVKLERK